MIVDETDVPGIAAQWINEGHKMALGTVVKTWGSAPRQAGSQIAVRGDGAFVGSVSGGCVEGAVIEQALIAIDDGKVRRLEFGVADETAWSVGLACGGRMEIFIEPLLDAKTRDSLVALNKERQTGNPIVRAVNLETGEAQLIAPGVDSSALDLAATEAVRSDQSALLEIGGHAWLLVVFNPPIDLAVVGAVHIAQCLAQIATPCGYRVRVIDPRRSFAAEERFPGVMLSHEWPDDELSKRPLGPRSALIVLAHDPKLDDPALSAALRSPAFYIGALGSKRTHVARLERLRVLGFTDDVLARIHAPIGLGIGAKGPQEIAISIIAQMIERLHAPSKSVI